MTGAGGFLGRALVARLREDGWRLVTLSLTPPPSQPFPGEVHLTADVCSGGWERWCEGCQVAVHLVGTARPAPATTDMERIHVTAAARITEACHNLGISRLVALSASGAAPDAATAFLRSKWAGERVVEGSGLAWTIVRPTVVFGENDTFSTGLSRFVRRFPVVPVPSDGTALFQPIAVEDVAAALTALVRNQAAAGRTVELGGLEKLKLDDVLHRVAHALDLHRPLVHVAPRFTVLANRLYRSRPGPWLTDDGLALLRSGSVAAPAPTDLNLPQPTRRFDKLPWLHPTTASAPPIGSPSP